MKKLIKILLIIVLVLAAIFAVFAILNKINEGVLRDYIETFNTVEVGDRLEPRVDEDGNYYFEADREFKVMQLTDIHIGGGILSQGKDKKAINAVAAMITEEKPDLVIVTGDIAFAVPFIAGTVNNAYAHEAFGQLMEKLGVYWTVTLGNHDSEAYNFHGRDAVAEMYMDEGLEHGLFSSADVSGRGNHVIHVKNSVGFITESFYMLDSHSYTEDDPLGLKWDYDYIKEDQIEWYRESVLRSVDYNDAVYASLSEEVKEYYQYGVTPKSLMFMHIPLLEVKMAYDEYVEAGRSDTGSVVYHGGVNGEDDEMICSSRTDTELYEVMLELGLTEAVFFGHDHLNNFVMEYNGLKFSYGYSIDYLAYSGIAEKGAQRGCTVILCSEGAESVIIHENYYQDKYAPLYEKEGVDMTP